ncbi:hypothetical protein HAX54_026870 [Datura stramonium]|uniref:Uncharacterized protein n=1 Tax=Datura stramonium TaxID=4076 RepID=A0ABS8V2J6_DATST|nr:hypothetical protein [Datura stramonium]
MANETMAEQQKKRTMEALERRFAQAKPSSGTAAQEQENCCYYNKAPVESDVGLFIRVTNTSTPVEVLLTISMSSFAPVFGFGGSKGQVKMAIFAFSILLWHLKLSEDESYLDQLQIHKLALYLLTFHHSVNFD